MERVDATPLLGAGASVLARFVGSSGGADPVLGRRPAWLEHADGKLR